MIHTIQTKLSRLGQQLACLLLIGWLLAPAVSKANTHPHTEPPHSDVVLGNSAFGGCTVSMAGSATMKITPPTAGAALHFDGGDDYVDCGNAAALQLTTGTLEAHIKTANAGDGFRGLVVKPGAFGLFLVDNVVTLYDWTSNQVLSSSSNLADDTWRHVAMTFNSGVTDGTKVYVDGNLVLTTTITVSSQDNSLVIGAGGTFSGQNFFGTMDEVRVWNRPLALCEIQNNMSCELGSGQTGLVAYYQLNQGIEAANNSSITTATDASGNGYDGTLTYFALDGATSNWAAPGGVTTGTTCTPVALPTAFNVTGGGAYSFGGTGVAVGLDNSESGMDYQLQLDGSSTGSSVAGTGAAISFGNQTTAGTYTVVASSPATGCTAAMTGSAIVALNGEALHFDGSDDYVDCGNAAALQLYSGTLEAHVKTAYAGDGLRGVIVKPTAFGLFLNDNVVTLYDWTSGQVFSSSSNLADDTWHHVAMTFKSGVTDGTKVYVDGTLVLTATITVQSQDQSLLIGAGNTSLEQNFYGTIDEVRVWNRVQSCELQSYMSCELSNPASAPGLVAYYPFNQGIAAANNSSIATATDASSKGNDGALTYFALDGPTSNWAAPGGVTPGVNCTPVTLPTAFNVTGGGAYCSGGAGVAIGLSNSESGMDYQLQLDGINTGSAIAGTGAAISFGNQTAAGTYTVEATNTTTGCTVTMADSAAVTVNPLPNVYPLVGGGSYCFGGTGVPIRLLGTQLGNTYQLQLNGVKTGGAIAGTGATYTFDNQTAAGTYTVVVTSTATGCTSMTNVVFVTVLPTPDAPVISGVPTICAGSTTTLSTQTQSGASYSWFTDTANDTWQPVGDGNASTGYATNGLSSLALNDNTPYVAYTDSDNDNKATVRKFNGTAWETVGSAGFSAGIATDLSLAISGGVPYAAYADFALGNKATVMKYNGTDWEVVGSAGFSTENVQNLNLVFSQGTPYLSYRDNENLGKATLMKYNGTAWEEVGNGGISTVGALNPSLAFDGSTPYVAYRDDATSGKATVKKYNGTAWETVGSAGFSAGQANFTSLAFDGNTPYVAYSDGAISGKATVKRYNGTAWETVGNAGFSAGFAQFISLAIHDGIPYVAFKNATGLRANVMRYNGTVWEIVGSPNFTGNAAGTNLVISGNTLYLNYLDYQSSNKSKVMRSDIPASITNSVTANTGDTYTVRVSINGCTASASQVVTQNALPTAQTLTGGGGYCAGGAGVELGLDNSETGMNYQLKIGGSNKGNPVAGTGAAISFGNQTAAGAYTVVATSTSGSCTALMTGSAQVSVKEAPTGISVSNISSCNGANTTCTSDDTYTANITVTYPAKPGTGALNLSGSDIAGTAPSIAVSSIGATSYTFTGVTLRADGAPIGLTAVFSANPDCSFTNSNAGTAPSCSNSCSISNISIANISSCNSNNTTTASDDYFTANVTVTFAYAPGSGNLVLKRGSLAIGTVAASSLSCVTSYTFTGVQMTANGAPILLTAEFSTCTYTTPNSLGNAPVSCSCVPAMTCPANITVSTGATTCNAAVTLTNPTVTENCGGTVTLVNDHPSTTYTLGTTTVNWSGAGTCSMTVTVIDNRLPVITCPANQTRVAGPINDLPIPTMSDNCGVDHYDGRYKLGTNWTGWKRRNGTGGPSPINTNIPNGIPNYVAGAYTVQYQVIDNSANLKVCQFSLTVTASLAQAPEDGTTNTAQAAAIKETAIIPATAPSYDLHCNPNPFSDQLNITFRLDKAATVRLSILDVTGREVGLIARQKMDAGAYNLPFQATALGDGIYFVRLQADEWSIMDKVILIR